MSNVFLIIRELVGYYRWKIFVTKNSWTENVDFFEMNQKMCCFRDKQVFYICSRFCYVVSIKDRRCCG